MEILSPRQQNTLQSQKNLWSLPRLRSNHQWLPLPARPNQWKGKNGYQRYLRSQNPWKLSSGMYGKHTLASPDSSQLAKKVNQNFSEMDKSSFFFVQNCGACHPGGGWGEYDRKGNLYYNEETKNLVMNFQEMIRCWMGTIPPSVMGNANYGAPWDQSGVSEADCLICHLKGYQWKERGATLRGRFFKYGPTVGAGWATVKLSQDESGNPKADEVNRRLYEKRGGRF